MLLAAVSALPGGKVLCQPVIVSVSVAGSLSSLCKIDKAVECIQGLHLEQKAGSARTTSNFPVVWCIPKFGSAKKCLSDRSCLPKRRFRGDTGCFLVTVQIEARGMAASRLQDSPVSYHVLPNATTPQVESLELEASFSLISKVPCDTTYNNGSSQASTEFTVPEKGDHVRTRSKDEIFASSSDPCSEIKTSSSLLVFSGGTAFNGVVEELKTFTTKVAHVLPVSDDGGSTAEIVRVLGGPAIGDIRSRCLRLSDGSTAEALAVKQLLGHRLPSNAQEAKSEWLSIVEGDHDLWESVSEPYKDTIRAFLVHFQHQILCHASAKFAFENGSVGNFFFAGARTFFRSLDAAIFLFSRVSHIPPESLVLPCICTNDRLTLGAELQDGTIIRGQHEISHPTGGHGTMLPSRSVNKTGCPPLPSPIKRLFYISSEGTSYMHEVYPQVNPHVLEQLRSVNAVIYGMGSLYTSICPSLVLRGVGEAISERNCPKILLLNGMHDRETDGMLASDFVMALCESLNRHYGEDPRSRLHHPPSAYVTAILAPKGGNISVDYERLQQLGVTNLVFVESLPDGDGALFEGKALIAALKQIVEG